MGINIGNHQVLSILLGVIPVTAVYLEDTKIWPFSSVPEPSAIEEIMSCYALGCWVDEYPWTDSTPWID